MGFTPLGIYYPELDSPNLATDIKRTMDDIDRIGSSISAFAASRRALNGFRIIGGNKMGGASWSMYAASFTGKNWDSGSHWSIGAPTSIFLDAGYWLINVKGTAYATAGTLYWGTIYFDIYGNSNCEPQSTASSAVQAYVSGTTVIKVNTGGVTTTCQVGAGTSGGANYDFTDVEVVAHMLRPL